MKWIQWDHGSWCLAVDEAVRGEIFDCHVHLNDFVDHASVEVGYGAIREITPTERDWMLVHPNEVWMQELL